MEPMTNKNVSNNNSEPKDQLIDSNEKKNEVQPKQNKTLPKKTNPNSKKSESLNPSLNNVFKELISKKAILEKEIKELEAQKIKINKEIESTFLGQSDNIAKRVKGFQDYLTGALQNLSQSVEKLELVSEPIIVKPSPLDQKGKKEQDLKTIEIQSVSETFKPDEKIIRNCLSLFTNQPDFYAEPWKLRRSLESADIEILEDWFFNMGGRGALESRGTRQRNGLLSAGLISILGELYGDQFQTLILASQPERLGEWRRVLQDSLGLTRDDFGPNSGIVLFERPEGVIERADRLEAIDEVPLIIIDAAETSVESPILQFPLWFAFVGTENEIYGDLDLNQ